MAAPDCCETAMDLLKMNARLALRSEITTLEQLLVELPQDRFVERMGLESRLQEARAELELHSAQPEEVQGTADSPEDEDEDTVSAQIIGILPESRAFEAKTPDGQILQGTIDRTVDIAQFKAKWENTPAVLTLRVVAVRGTKRFVLSSATQGVPEPRHVDPVGR